MNADTAEFTAAIPPEDRPVPLQEKQHTSVSATPIFVSIARLSKNGRTALEIARELGVSYETVLATKRTPHFKAELRELIGMEEEVAAQLQDRLSLLGDDGVEYLEKVLTGVEEATPQVKTKAALAVLDKLGVGASNENKPIAIIVNQHMESSQLTTEEAVELLNKELERQTIRGRK